MVISPLLHPLNFVSQDAETAQTGSQVTGICLTMQVPQNPPSLGLATAALHESRVGKSSSDATIMAVLEYEDVAL